MFPRANLLMFNILFVTYYNFELKKGGNVNRVLGLANSLSKRVNVMVLHQGSNMIINKIRFFHYDPFLSFNKSNSLLINVMHSYASSITNSIRKSIETIALTEEIDIIQVEQLYPFPQSLISRNSLDKKILLSLDEHNVEFSTFKSKISGISLNSIYSAFTLPYIKTMESFATHNSDVILCVSRRDSISLEKLYNLNSEKLYVVPNGVDLYSYEKGSHPKNYDDFEKIIFFHGTLSWYPNLEAANIILNYIAPKIEEATFIICGSNPPKSFLKKTMNVKNVRYLGYVNPLPSYIKSSDICIAPIMRGGGTKLKLLEYAAAGRPIVATYKAVEGLPFIDEKNALLFEKVDEGFIDAIKNLLSDERFSDDLKINAKKLAETFDWSNIASKLYTNYKYLLEKITRT